MVLMMTVLLMMLMTKMKHKSTLFQGGKRRPHLDYLWQCITDTCDAIIMHNRYL